MRMGVETWSLGGSWCVVAIPDSSSAEYQGWWIYLLEKSSGSRSQRGIVENPRRRWRRGVE